MIFGGCDVGSTTGKVVLLDGDDVVATAIVPARVDPEETANLAMAEALRDLDGIDGPEDLGGVVGTGYGRVTIPFAESNLSEITCHAVGAHHCDGAVRTIVDIGGQDVKAIAANEDGTVREFAMNDRCAAGTGRFFEAMARAFDMDLVEFSELSSSARSVVPVTAQCSVFAESEVVSLIAQRREPADIAAGIQAAVAKRVFALARRVGVRERLVITGGCAKNAGLARALRKLLRVEVHPLPIDAQLAGALGAAVLARGASRKGHRF